MKKISIIGAGQIGKNLALLFTGLNVKTFLMTRDIQKTKKEIKYLKRITQKTNKALNFQDNEVFITDDYSDLHDSSLIIESVSEKLESKKEIFAKINNIVDKDTLIATTTSTMSITELSAPLSLKENFLGMHFFNPPTIINFLEVIKSNSTSDQTIMSIKSFLDDKKIKYILLEKDSPGFIVNRALFLMLNEAIQELSEGLASPIEIDKAFKLGLHHPMGPLELCDFIGLDITLDILTCLFEKFNNSKYQPCDLLKEKVNANKLGKKTKEGFYKYH